MNFKTVIGLEVHVQLNTVSKLFCSCKAGFGKEQNTLTCPVCTGQPGALPVLNLQALYQTVTAGLALRCHISPLIRFDRKNYFYPDLPKGYQISQFDVPVGTNGYIEFEKKSGRCKRIGISHVHLEEDAGKAIHLDRPAISLIDLNRAGIPLLEIVSDPDIRSPAEARSCLMAIKQLMQYIDVSECDMEKGSLRCDVNISLLPVGRKKLGEKIEIKNLNSFKNVEKALSHEEERLKNILDKGEGVDPETRMWNETRKTTVTMRSKEETHDYRYFPDPDLLPVKIPRKFIKNIQASLSEPPLLKKQRFITEYNLSARGARFLTADRLTADFFENCVAACGAPKDAANWIQGPLMKEMKKRRVTIDGLNISPARLAELISIVNSGKISRQSAQKMIRIIAETGKSPEKLVREMELEQVSDRRTIGKIVDDVIEKNKCIVEQYRHGKKNALNALIGLVMKATSGKADPETVHEIFEEKL